jgi:hypothetical protein
MSRVGHIALKSASPQAFYYCAATQTLVFKSAIAVIALQNFRPNFNRNCYELTLFEIV